MPASLDEFYVDRNLQEYCGKTHGDQTAKLVRVRWRAGGEWEYYLVTKKEEIYLGATLWEPCSPGRRAELLGMTVERLLEEEARD